MLLGMMHCHLKNGDGELQAIFSTNLSFCDLCDYYCAYFLKISSRPALAKAQSFIKSFMSAIFDL